jgi:tetratricopeptide (TPR) repeat protein
MNRNDKKIIQDIYANESSEKDVYTPQINPEVIKEKKRFIKRQQQVNLFSGILVLLLSISLLYIIITNYVDSLEEAAPIKPISQEYIPRYALDQESQWVLDLNKDYGQSNLKGTETPSLNRVWIKKAAFNIIMAEKAYEIKEYASAAKYYKQVLKIYPDVENVKAPLGVCYFNMEEYEKAIELFRDTDVEELGFVLLNNLAIACIETDAFDVAEEYLLKALEKNPLYTPTLKNLALLYSTDNQHALAIKFYDNYFDFRPEDHDSRYDYALYLTQEGEWALASEQINLLTLAITDVANLYHLQARVELKLGNPMKALEATRKAAQLSDPKNALQWMSDEEFDQLRTVPDFQPLMKYRSE